MLSMESGDPLRPAGRHPQSCCIRARSQPSPSRGHQVRIDTPTSAHLHREEERRNMRGFTGGTAIARYLLRLASGYCRRLRLERQDPFQATFPST